MAHPNPFDPMHESFIRWLIVAGELSDGEVAAIAGVNRRQIQHVRERLGIEPNYSPGKRMKKRLAIFEVCSSIN